MTFEEWKDGYGLVLEPNYSKETEADCLAAFNFGKRESAVLIERQAVQIEMMREALQHLLCDVGQTNSMLGAIKARKALSTTPDQALEQFAAKVREQCAEVCEAEYVNVADGDDEVYNSAITHASRGIRAIKELP